MILLHAAASLRHLHEFIILLPLRIWCSMRWWRRHTIYGWWWLHDADMRIYYAFYFRHFDATGHAYGCARTITYLLYYFMKMPHYYYAFSFSGCRRDAIIYACDVLLPLHTALAAIMLLHSWHYSTIYMLRAYDICWTHYASIFSPRLRCQCAF